MMDINNYWSKYNKNLLELNSKILNHNMKHNFNYVEDSFYNHIRDILSLVILKLDNGYPLKVLDYGSNILTWTNLKNKISLANLEISIYDPFNIKEYEKVGKNIEIFSNSELIKKSYFNLTLFGSSSQYIDKFYDLLKDYREILSNHILFTHTPFSLKEDFKSFQFTGYTGTQNVRSYKTLEEFFLKRNYQLVFKSIIDNKFASVEEKYFNQTIYANILFSKIS